MMPAYTDDAARDTAASECAAPLLQSGTVCCTLLELSYTNYCDCNALRRPKERVVQTQSDDALRATYSLAFENICTFGSFLHDNTPLVLLPKACSIREASICGSSRGPR